LRISNFDYRGLSLTGEQLGNSQSEIRKWRFFTAVVLCQWTVMEMARKAEMQTAVAAGKTGKLIVCENERRRI